MNSSLQETIQKNKLPELIQKAREWFKNPDFDINVHWDTFTEEEDFIALESEIKNLELIMSKHHEDEIWKRISSFNFSNVAGQNLPLLNYDQNKKNIELQANFSKIKWGNKRLIDLLSESLG